VKPQPILTPAEREQSGWRKAEDAIKTELAKHRKRLESIATPPAERELLVARIDELKKVLAYAEPKTN
jgi:hypothetical protein